MDIKQKLLLYLYENRHSSYQLEINHIFKDCELKPIDIQALIGDLKRNNIIETDNKYARLGCSSFSSDKSILYYTIDNVELKAKLVSITGEQYVRDNYLKQNTNPIINASQVVYANGDINAPVSQANDRSESKNSISKAPIKAKRPIIIKIGKYILGIITIIVTLYAFYEILKSFTNH